MASSKVQEEKKEVSLDKEKLEQERIEQERLEQERRKKEFYNEKIPVFIRRPEGVKDNAATITLNGTNYQIMYDREVMVPRCVALIAEEAQRNNMIAEGRARELAEANQFLGDM